MTSRLLFLTNDPAYWDHLHIRLESTGCHIHFARTPAELNELLAQHWNVIVSDSHFGGLEPGKLLAQLNPHKHTVFFYTENSAHNSADSWKTLGVREVFSKLRRGELIKAIQASLPGATTAAPTPASSAVQASSSRVGKFLVVDDSPTIRKFVKKVIEGGFPGSEVYEAEDGKTAMHELSGQKMDLIVTDMQMPGVDGMSFIKTLHRNPLLNKKPIIILSGMVTREMQAELGSVPTVRILAKPADPKTIVSTIQSLLTTKTVSN